MTNYNATLMLEEKYCIQGFLTLAKPVAMAKRSNPFILRLNQFKRRRRLLK